MEQSNSFYHIISSENRLNKEPSPMEYEFILPSFSSGITSSYQVEVTSFITSDLINKENGYTILTCNGLNLNNGLCIKYGCGDMICTIPCNSYSSVGNVSFPLDCSQHNRILKFRFLDSSYEPLGGVDVKWLLTLKFTPTYK